MRTITLRYAGECRKCSAALAEGQSAVYERRIGVFCPNCAPTDPEVIRDYRQEGADRKAERYEGWAAKRTATATATLRHNERYTGDIAFNTQPGTFPLRERVIRQTDAACDSLAIARNLQDKAERLRHVRVAGDAERHREKIREAIRPLLHKGQLVFSPMYGEGRIVRINKKTVNVKRGQTGSIVQEGIHWLKLLEN